MISFLIHGCYDSKTLDTLKNLGTNEIAFDLRVRSSNLVPFSELQKLLNSTTLQRVFLTFENDRKETILSYLDLLKNQPINFNLIFRDQLPTVYYQQFSTPFFWMFHPDGDWKGILRLTQLKGVILPVKWQATYQVLPELWDLIDKNNLEVYLHADNGEEALSLHLEKEMKLSLDLTSEVESSYRAVDQEKLKKMKIWRRLNENITRQ